MLNELFSALVVTSLAGTALAALITLLKPVTKRFFNCAWHYYIWLAVLFVMLIPVRFSLPQSVNTTVSVTDIQTADTIPVADAVPSDIAAAPDTVITAGAQKTTDFIRNILISAQNYFGIMWIIGVILFLFSNIIGYIRLVLKVNKNSYVSECLELKSFTNRKITVRIGKDLSSPFMLGVFCPVLVLPETNLSAAELNNILRHEMTHFKRRDVLYKWCAVLVRCIHWFNPAAYYIVRQINSECEISCDAAVVSKMNDGEKRSYINTILSLLSSANSKQVSLTTGMASEKKVLKRRFTMIKNAKKTSKFISAVSVIIAAVMLTATVFASGLLSDMTTDDYTIKITDSGTEITLTNKPFIENEEVYVPLRELFEKLDIINNLSSKIEWNSGQITVTFDYSNGEQIKTWTVYAQDDYTMQIGDDTGKKNSLLDDRFEMEIGKNHLVYSPTHDMPNSRADRATLNAPVLKNSVTYVPISYIIYMGFPYTAYTVYDKNGNTITLSQTSAEREHMQDPEYVISRFFNAFSMQEFAQMKNFCTQYCIENFWGNDSWDSGYVFGMYNSELKSLYIDPLEYAKSSNDFIAEVSVYMKPAVGSVYLPGQTEATFYVILMRQPNGTYLIDQFATGL